MKLEFNTQSKTTRVLVLEVARLGVRQYLEREKEVFTDCEFFYSPLVDKNATLLTIYEACRELIELHDIDVAISICDRSTPILAALTTDFPHLKGPKYEAFHLTADKVLSRQMIIPEEYNLPFFALSSKHIEDGISSEEIMGTIGLPGFAKPANGMGSGMVCKLSATEDLKKLVTEEFQNSLNTLMEPMNDFIQRFLDHEKFPGALTPHYILEKYVDNTMAGVTVHTVDGLVSKGNMIPWAISDNIYWASRPETFMGELMPSRLSQEMQTKAFNCLQAIVNNMIPYGFDDQYINAEVFCYPNGDIKVMEVNGRMCSMLKDLYDNAIDHDSIMKVAIDVGLGKDVISQQPPLKENTTAFIAYLCTYGTGVGKDFIDFDNLSNYPTETKDIRIELKVNEDTTVKQVGDYGFCLGYANIRGTNYDDCMAKMEIVKADLLKRPESSPWSIC